jgi:hypothetical protein
MPFIAECQYCKSHIRATDNSMGMSATCPRCGNCFTLAPMAKPPAVVKNKKKAYRKSVPTPYGEVEDIPAKTLPGQSAAVLTGSDEVAAAAPTETNATLQTDDDVPPLIEDQPTAPVPADDDAEESPFAPPPRPRQPLSKLGALAFLCGSVALLLGQFPFLQFAILPVAGLGLLLGIIGYVVAANSEERLILLPAIGAVVSGVVLLVAGLFPSWIGIDRRARDVAAELKARRQVVVPMRGEPTAPPQAVDAEGWIDASSGVLQQSDLRLSLLFAVVDFPQIKTEGKQKPGKERFLAIHLRIQNIGAARKIPYVSWTAPVAGGDKSEPILTDDQGKTYGRKAFGPDVEVLGQTRKAEVYPGRFVEDVVFFEAPATTADYLRLELPLAACGSPGKCRFQIPKSMIQWRNNKVAK